MDWFLQHVDLELAFESKHVCIPNHNCGPPRPWKDHYRQVPRFQRSGSARREERRLVGNVSDGSGRQLMSSG